MKTFVLLALLGTVYAAQYPEIPCGKRVDRGNCDENLPRWYFNRKTGTCEKFYYGGCGGNENRFEEKEMCEQTCVFPPFTPYPEIPCGKPVDRGNCDDNLPRWYFNRKTGKCEKFYYGGCGGNENRFEEKETCEQTCVFPALLVDNQCQRPPHRGPCLGNLRRFYYDSSEETCHPFVYGGCQSNGNNFESFSLCMDACNRR
ncbi:hypothetical protein HPB50_006569 [Hyalomma asiaticum]|uniref:Uncharacterized protein n=1 Tax=Hyalomma asiaticum TaxID=266040 RepID=A0ACB7RSP8_HYAAI|nr:hypothetical protein HPB50_006569 [Hyalomma asiaticum]